MRTLKTNYNSISNICNELKPVKKLSDCTGEELVSIMENNSFVREECEKRAVENMDFWWSIDEYLRYICKVPGIDYNFGYPGNYMCFRAYEKDHYREFFEACLKTQKDYGLFSDETAAKIDRAYKKIEFWEDCVYGYEEISDSRLNHLEGFLKNTFEEAKNSIFWAYDMEENYVYTVDAAIDNLEFWADDHENDYYTDGVKLYEF